MQIDHRKWCASLGAFVNVTSDNSDSWREQMMRIRRLPGRGHVEIYCEWLPTSATEMARLKSTFEGERVVMHAPFVGVSLATSWTDLWRISIDRMARAVRIAQSLGAEVLTIHPGLISIFEDRQHALDRILEARQILQAQANLIVAIENMPYRPTASVEGVVSMADFSALLERDPSTKFTLDVGHALQNDDKYHEFLLEHPQAVVNMHLHDAMVNGQGHLRLGAGCLDLRGYIEHCREAGYAGLVSLETLSPADTQASWTSVRRFNSPSPSIS